MRKTQVINAYVNETDVYLADGELMRFNAVVSSRLKLTVNHVLVVRLHACPLKHGQI